MERQLGLLGPPDSPAPWTGQEPRDEPTTVLQSPSTRREGPGRGRQARPCWVLRSGRWPEVTSRGAAHWSGAQNAQLPVSEHGSQETPCRQTPGRSHEHDCVCSCFPAHSHATHPPTLLARAPRGGKPVQTAPGRSRVPGTPRQDASWLVSRPGFPVQRGPVLSGGSITLLRSLPGHQGSVGPKSPLNGDTSYEARFTGMATRQSLSRAIATPTASPLPAPILFC